MSTLAMQFDNAAGLIDNGCMRARWFSKCRVRPSASSVLLSLILLGSLFAGLHGSAWGHPFDFHSDEFFYLNRVAADPATPFWTIYGRWPIYLVRAASALWGQAPDFVLARQISALITVWGVAATALAAREIAGRSSMLLAAALLAGAPIVVQSAHFFITDVLLAAGLASALLFALRVVRYGRWADSVALALAWGIATGSKLSGGFLLPAIFIAHLLSPTTHRWRRMGAVLLIAGCLALLGQPTLIQHGVRAYLFKGALLEHLRVAAGISRPPYSLQFAYTGAWTYYLTHLFPWGAGPLFMLSGGLGFTAALVRLFQRYRTWRSDKRTGQLVVVCLAFLVVYLASAGHYDKFARYILPLLPPLAILAGWFFAECCERPRRAAGRVLLAGGIAGALLPGLLYANIYTRPDTRLQAADWLAHHVPAGASICHEPDLGFAVPPIGLGGPAIDAALERNYQGILLNWGMLYWASDYPRLYHQSVLPETPDALRSQEAQANLIADWLAACDWIVLSDRFADQYLPLASDFPAISNFYRALLSGDHPEFRQIAAFRSLPGFAGWTVNDRSSELTFRSFDHPTFWIFGRHNRGAILTNHLFRG